MTWTEHSKDLSADEIEEIVWEKFKGQPPYRKVPTDIEFKIEIREDGKPVLTGAHLSWRVYA